MENKREKEVGSSSSSSQFLSTEEERVVEEESNQDPDDPLQIVEPQIANPAECTCPEGVCICHYLPSLPFATQTSVFLLHHPDETRHSINHLATLSFLSNGLSRLQLISGRRLYPGQIPLLDSLQESPSSSSPVLFLFPTPDAVDLSEWVRSTPPESRTEPVLVVVDGTWNQAWEMANNSLPFLSNFSTCISLTPELGKNCDQSQGATSPFMEKFMEKFMDGIEGGKSSEMTTIVAIARALRILEPRGAGTDALVESLMTVRRATVGRGPMGGSSSGNSRLKTKKNKGKK